METVKGSQDPVLYHTSRVGDVRVDHPIANGTYDVTFHFAEPEQIGGGERMFDAFAEGRLVIDDLDVMLFRDGKVESGLTVTAPNVAVTDGELSIELEAYYWLVWEQRKGRVLLDDVADAFHVYAMEWTPERIDVFVDDTLYFTYMNEHEGWEEWPFDKPFHLILNVAVGGAWGRAGGPIDDTVFPQRMLVDYVRVYQRP